jgi:hypothetical protein
MADGHYNPFKSPTCSFEEAVLWVARRTCGASSLFSLREWEDEITKAFWLLLRELAKEERTIYSFSPFVS